MALLKSGSRLRSQVDTTEMIVVRAPEEDLDLRAGGHPVVDLGATPEAGLELVAGEPALVGKRYTREAGDLESLVTKAGQAGLAIGDTPLVRLGRIGNCRGGRLPHLGRPTREMDQSRWKALARPDGREGLDRADLAQGVWRRGTFVRRSARAAAGVEPHQGAAAIALVRHLDVGAGASRICQ